MPLLDVSWVVDDPMLADRFNVTRRQDVIDDHGRTQPTQEETFTAQRGVITQQSPADLMRREEGQYVPRRIFLASRFAFRGASRSADGAINYQPDQILWPVNDDGTAAPGATLYTIEEVLPYHRYGRGIYEAIAGSQQAIDPSQ